MALGQTFINPSGDGFYVTSVDVFFEEKDTALPVTLGIVNTYGEKPSNKILPFSTVTKNASDINIIFFILNCFMISRQIYKKY